MFIIKIETNKIIKMDKLQISRHINRRTMLTTRNSADFSRHNDISNLSTIDNILNIPLQTPNQKQKVQQIVITDFHQKINKYDKP